MGTRYMSLMELAKLIGLAPKTLRNWKYSDPSKLPPYKVIKSGTRELLRFDVSEVERWLNNGRQGETL